MMCKRDGCHKPAWARGLCQAHYRAELRAERAAGIVAGPARTETVGIRFTPAERAQLEAAAKARQCDVSELARNLILSNLKNAIDS